MALDAKWDVSDLVTDHFATLVNDRTGKVRLGDYVAFVGLPVGMATTALLLGMRLQHVSDLLAGIAIFTGALFALLLQVFALGLRMSDQRKGVRTVADELVDELMANLAYACLVSILATALLIAAGQVTDAKKGLNAPLSAAVFGVLVHLILTVLMALKRTRAAYKISRR